MNELSNDNTSICKIEQLLISTRKNLPSPLETTKKSTIDFCSDDCKILVMKHNKPALKKRFFVLLTSALLVCLLCTNQLTVAKADPQLSNNGAAAASSTGPSAGPNNGGQPNSGSEVGGSGISNTQVTASVSSSSNGGGGGGASGAGAAASSAAGAGSNVATGATATSSAGSGSVSSAGASAGAGAGASSATAAATTASGSSAGASAASSASANSGSNSPGAGAGNGAAAGAGASASATVTTNAGSGSAQSQQNQPKLQDQPMGLSTTAKPEGLFAKMKDIFKESKEIIKSTVQGGTKEDKKMNSEMPPQSNALTNQITPTPKPEGIVDKVVDIAKTGKDMVKDGINTSVDKAVDVAKKGKEVVKDGINSSIDKVVGVAKEGKELVKEGVHDLAKKGKEVLKEGKESLKEDVHDIARKGKELLHEGKESIKEDIHDKVGHVVKKGKEMIREKKESAKEGIVDKVIDIAKKGKEIVKEGIVDKAIDIAKKGTELVKEDIVNKVNYVAKKGKEMVKDDIKEKKEEIKDKIHGAVKKGEDVKEGIMNKVQKTISKGTEVVKDTIHKFEDKASEVGNKVTKAIDDNVFKPMQATSGSGKLNSEGKLTNESSMNSKLKGSERDKHLTDLKKKQDSEIKRPSSLKEVVNSAKARGIIPQNEDRSVLKGNHADEKSVAVEVFDKAHELSKMPVEKILKPVDKMLGYEKDPILRLYDNSHELLRRPLSLFSKPVEKMLNGAFKTTEEAKKDSEKLLSTRSQQEQREAKMKEAVAKKEDRSIAGDIADKTVELATKPVEIVLRPLDHALGFDKDGRKNPLLKILNEIYGLSKKPIDTLAKPLETILRKMADEGKVYQISVRYDDPKIVTRLADGALNIADRVITKPLEIVMKPLDHALGYDEPGKRNPIVEAAHSLKNATKVGVELFTKPIDRIIKEIAEIGENKNEMQYEAEMERQKEDASRIVHIMDKVHEAAQIPFEIVLRPVSKAFGLNKDGKKEPVLRAWDVIHQVLRTPVQVISKPIEEAFLGESPRSKEHKAHQAALAAKAKAAGQGPKSSGEEKGQRGRKNVFIDGIKKFERIASKPIEVITSPIRRVLLGEDNEKAGNDAEKTNRAIQAKANGKLGSERSNQPDKIVTSLEKMNNVLLKPLELVSQPLSDILTHEDKTSFSEKKSELKQQVQSKIQSPKQQIQATIRTS